MIEGRRRRAGLGGQGGDALWTRSGRLSAGMGVPAVLWRDGMAHGHVQDVGDLLQIGDDKSSSVELHGKLLAQEVNLCRKNGMPLTPAVLGRVKAKAVHGQVPGWIRVAQKFVQNFSENKTHDFMCLPIRAETGQVCFIRVMDWTCSCFCISGLLG